MPQLATRADRLVATLMDGLIVGLPLLGIFFLSGEFGMVIGAMFLLSILFVQLYFLSTRGQTLGKMRCRIKIVDVKTNQNGGLVQNVLRRGLVNGLLSALPFYSLVDILFIFREDRRCLHDLIAGTIVIQA